MQHFIPSHVPLGSGAARLALCPARVRGRVKPWIAADYRQRLQGSSMGHLCHVEGIPEFLFYVSNVHASLLISRRPSSVIFHCPCQPSYFTQPA